MLVDRRCSSSLSLVVPLLWLGGCVELPFQGFAADSAEPLRFALPLAERDLFTSIIGVDHDPKAHTDAAIANSICEDYLGRGFPHCYDQHDGSDFILRGGFGAMDEGSTLIVAAADGVVIDLESEQYDRCHADIEAGEVSCDGRDLLANYVILEHRDGTQTKYWHMATDSVLVEVDQEVRCGEPLGLVGSSGNSSMPHLHFEVELDDGEVIDPFVPEDEGDSWWLDQGLVDKMPGVPCEVP